MNDIDDPYPSSDFDDWAGTYDQDVLAPEPFPFAGYARVLGTVVRLAEPEPGMSVLDLGTGTGNLALLFAARGCDVWGTDFSEAMLAEARAKLPHAHLVAHDLRDAWPAELPQRFDRVVSAYVFHHLALVEKVALCRETVEQRLAPGGRLVIADLSFPDRPSMDAFAAAVGELWEVEDYWLADEALAGLAGAGMTAGYAQVSGCAGVYSIHAAALTPTRPVVAEAPPSAARCSGQAASP